MGEFSDTTKISIAELQAAMQQEVDAKSILMNVYHSLQAKGYDPISQLVGYLISGDPTYITSYNQARSTICRMERDEIVEELVQYYINGHNE